MKRKKIVLPILIVIAIITSNYIFTYFLISNELIHSTNLIEYGPLAISKESDPNTIFYQTGLTIRSLETTNINKQDKTLSLYQNDLFFNKQFTCDKTSIFTREDVLLNDHLPFLNLKNGDIIITLDAHSFGILHGHAALVINENTKYVLEAINYQSPTCLSHISRFYNYPSAIQLRYIASDTIPNDVAIYATKNLFDVPYNIFANRFSDAKVGTHCSHLIWSAYKHFGVDLVSNYNFIISVIDLLKSSKLEIVQVLGANPKKIIQFKHS